ncbi:MAG: sensor histidine kinase [Candidatus Dormibacteria bacterium]
MELAWQDESSAPQGSIGDDPVPSRLPIDMRERDIRGATTLHSDLASEFASVTEPADLLRLVIMRAVIETVSDRGVISWLDGVEMVVADCYDPFGEPAPPGSRWTLESSEVTRVACATGKPTSAPYTPPGPGAASGPRESPTGLRQVLVVPVEVAGEAIAVLAVSRRRAEDFSEADTAALGAIARHAAQPLLALRLRQQLEAARAQLDETRRQADSVERVKTDILRLASHELRTPLTVLNGYLSLIAAGFFGDVPETLRGILPILTRRVEDMNSLVNDMLVAARVEATVGHEAVETVDLRSLVEQAFASIRPRAAAAHDLILTLPSDPVPVVVDAERVHLAVRNILDNAVKYSPMGGEVRCEVEVEQGTATVRISDHGLGIDAADRHRLFTRFGRILTTTNSHIPGIGLGLYFSREVARRHGGDVALVDGDRGETTFELTLPVGPAA